MIDLNYHHLYYFYTVAKTGSIAKARETLLLAQPTISAQLKELEAQLGRPLFEREGRGLRLTEDGRFVLDYAQSIFELGRELRDSLRDRRPAGTLSVQLGAAAGTPPSFAHALLEKALSLRPGAHATLKEGSLEELAGDLLEHRVDLVMADAAYAGPGREELTASLAGEVPVVLAASPALARRCGKSPAQLARAPWVLPTAPKGVHERVLALLARWGIEPEIAAEVGDVELARRLALGGRGVTPLNAYTVEMSLPKGGLVVVAGPRMTRVSEPVFLLARKRKWVNPLAEELLRTFRLPGASRGSR